MNAKRLHAAICKHHQQIATSIQAMLGFGEEKCTACSTNEPCGLAGFVTVQSQAVQDLRACLTAKQQVAGQDTLRRHHVHSSVLRIEASLRRISTTAIVTILEKRTQIDLKEDVQNS